MSNRSFHKYLFYACYLPGSVDPEMNKTDEVLIFMEYTIQWEKTEYIKQ